MNPKAMGLGAAVLLQILVLCSITFTAYLPLKTGQPITLATVPVDPRSLFRGNYARLRYEISNLPIQDINRLVRPRQNEIIYVILSRDSNGIHRYKGVSLTKPDQGVFIRGRIRETSRSQASGWTTYPVTYGIEAWFAPKEKALALEKQLRHSGVAKIRVSKNGKAALEAIVDASEQP